MTLKLRILRMLLSRRIFSGIGGFMVAGLFHGNNGFLKVYELFDKKLPKNLTNSNKIISVTQYLLSLWIFLKKILIILCASFFGLNFFSRFFKIVRNFSIQPYSHFKRKKKTPEQSQLLKRDSSCCDKLWISGSISSQDQSWHLFCGHYLPVFYSHDLRKRCKSYL